MKKAVFAGSFDPFTLGHKDIVLRASTVFDEVIVAVAVSTGKSSRDIEKRVEIARQSLIEFEAVKVIGFDGLLTDFMKNNNAVILVRGVRTYADFEYEKSLLNVYKSLFSDIELVLMPAKAGLSHISSTVVRDLCKLHAPIAGYVDTKVEKSVRELYVN